MFPIRIAHDGSTHALPAGGRYARPRDHGFRDTAASDLQSLIAEIDRGRPWRESVANRYEKTKPWLCRIVTDPSRTAFFDRVLPAGSGAILDIGSGWGQIARPLARERPVVALEPVAERLGFIEAAARQDGLAGQMAFVEADYFEITFETRFSVITAIGVLEWAGAFQDAFDPQERQRAFLRKARGELAPGGCLVLAIENRLGLKYLLGCPDDHIGVAHVASLPAPLARDRWNATTGNRLQSFTYSQAELTALLRDAGFARTDFFAAFPDYKLPAHIADLADGGLALNQWLLEADRVPPEHNGYDGTTLSRTDQDLLRSHYRGLARAGSAHLFVPSFFVRAWVD